MRVRYNSRFRTPPVSIQYPSCKSGIQCEHGELPCVAIVCTLYLNGNVLKEMGEAEVGYLALVIFINLQK